MSVIAASMAWLLFGVVALSVVAQVALYVSACVELRRIRRRDRHQLWRRMLTSPLAPRISVLVPAYNESLSIVNSVTNLLALTYTNLEVVVINDGSADDTLDKLVDAFDLAPVLPVYRRVIDTAEVLQIYRSPDDSRLVVVDKHNGGKADASNVGLNLATGKLVCAIDADTLVAPDALQQLVVPFLAGDDTVAVGGTVRLVNDAEWHDGLVDHLRAPRALLVGAQAVEYSRSFLVGRLAWNPLGGNLIISGAFGVFDKQALLDIGGYEHRSIGEDMELIVRLRRTAYEAGKVARVEFTPDPVAFTEAPASMRTLARQRNRWFRGLLDVLVRHRRMILNRRYGTAGLLAMPYFVLVEALAPVLEFIGICFLILALAFGWISPGALAPVSVAYLLGICATYAVLVVDDLVFRTYRRTGDRILMVFHVLIEQVVFRPLTIVWRLWGLRLFLQGRTEWGAQERRGFATST